MSRTREVVDLPPVESKPVLRPLDVAPARWPYLVSWFMDRLASLPIVFLFGVTLWVVSGAMLISILVPLGVLVAAALASRYFAAQAWGYIPRKRQDRRRGPGAVNQLVVLSVDAAALVSGLAILVSWLSDRGVRDDVAAFAIGAGAGIGALQLVEVVVAAVRRPPDRAAAASRLLFLVAVALAVFVASETLIGDRWNAASVTVALIGGGTMFVIQAAWWIARLLGARGARPRGDEQ